METKMKKFNNLTKTQFDLELLRLNQFIYRKYSELALLLEEKDFLIKAARTQKIIKQNDRIY